MYRQTAKLDGQAETCEQPEWRLGVYADVNGTQGDVAGRRWDFVHQGKEIGHGLRCRCECSGAGKASITEQMCKGNDDHVAGIEKRIG